MYTLLHTGSMVIILIYFALLLAIFIKQDKFKIKTVTQISSVALCTVLFFNLIISMIGHPVMMNHMKEEIYSDMPAVAISIFAGHALISWLFDFLDRQLSQAWLKVIYYIGMILVAVVGYYATVGSYFNGIFDAIFGSTLLVCFLVVVCTVPFALLALVIEKIANRKMTPKSYHAKPNHNKLKHYREHGLTEQEIIFFRQQMAEAKVRIENIETEMAKVAKLRVIENRHNVVEVSKQYFKDIVNEPERMAQAGIFLNKLLPSLEDLTAKYTEVSGHVAKTKQTYLILEKSALTIENICESITENYVNFHQSLYNDLQDEIRLANRALNKEGEPESVDTVDELVKDPFNFEEE